MSDIVPIDPRLPWVQPDWLARATGWIHARLEERGLELTAEIEQPHVRWWSTVMRVRTSEGDLWFKANAPPHAFEAALIAILERLSPGRVPELVALDVDQGWLLMRDGGTRLRELVRSNADLHHWQDVLPGYAELQLAVAPRAGELLAAGVPDERLAVLAEHLERLLDDTEALLVGRPEGLTADEHARLRAFLPEITWACDHLISYGIPETLQHDDFHDGNVFVRDGRYLFFDWGDSCVSHPFHTLVVTMRAIAHRLELPPGGPDLRRLLDAYLEPFSPYGSPTELRAAANLAHRTGTAARSVAWHRFLSCREPEFRADDAAAVPYGLKRLLAGGPIGSWS
jgi:aminoglycoside/choline kinase family phosphotransferase